MIANTVPLVKQQADAIRTHTGFEVRAYDGSMGVDFWKEDEVSAYAYLCGFFIRYII